MSQSSSSVVLESRIDELELSRQEQMIALRTSTRHFINSVSPGQIVKKALDEFATSGNLRTGLLRTAIGVGAGLITKRIIRHSSPGLAKKITAWTLLFFLTVWIRKKMS